MKKRHNTSIPDFSRKRPGAAAADAAPTIAGDKPHKPNPRQPQKPPAKAKNGGRRGT